MITANETVGYELEEALVMLSEAGISVSEVRRVGPTRTGANEQEVVVRQKPGANGQVELTVSRRWVTA